MTDATTTDAATLVERRIAQVLEQAPPATSDAPTFARARFDAGLAWVWFPEGHGGLGVERDWQGTVESAFRAAHAPEMPSNVLGTHMAAPTIVDHGTEAQRSQWLRRIYTSGEIWCQLFSEPGAGSDLGGLATRAERDGDTWIVNGQKVWTTSAFGSKWGLLVARTDPDAPKHRGISFFIIDMEQPGVEVRPLRQITGEAEFNEVFMSDAVVQDADRIGDVDNGWPVLLSTLMNERLVFTGDAGPSSASQMIKVLVDLYRQSGSDDPVKRDAVMRLWVDTEANRLLNMRTSQLRAFDRPGPDGSLGKLGVTELNKRVTAMIPNVLGMAGTILPGAYPVPGDDADELARHPLFRFLRARGNSIEGGTSEMHRNQIGERVLGLPGEPRGDKGVPWRLIPRN
jgi:alkylation response protein AidB-like acyl-CoA dehydrogenase